MPLSQIPTKETTRLFNNKYKYKIVIVTALSTWFRGDNLSRIQEKIDHYDATKAKQHRSELGGVKFVQELYNKLSNMLDYNLRVEHPYISIYSNSETDITDIANIDLQQVKFVCRPKHEKLLAVNTIIAPHINFLYKVTLGKTQQPYHSFIKWCENNNKIKISKGTTKRLMQSTSYQGGFFYVKDDKALTVVKMFVGSCITKIETIVKP